MTRARMLGWTLTGFGLVAAIMALLVDGVGRQRALLRERLAVEGVTVEPVDLWIRSPSRSGQPHRVVVYRFESEPGIEAEGADPVPLPDLEALLEAGVPQVTFLPDRPEVNALSATVAAARAAGGPAARRRSPAIWLLAAVAAGFLTVGITLLRRQRRQQPVA